MSMVWVEWGNDKGWGEACRQRQLHIVNGATPRPIWIHSYDIPVQNMSMVRLGESGMSSSASAYTFFTSSAILRMDWLV